MRVWRLWAETSLIARADMDRHLAERPMVGIPCYHDETGRVWPEPDTGFLVEAPPAQAGSIVEQPITVN